MNFEEHRPCGLRSDRRSKPVTEHAAAAVAAEDEHRAARRLPLRHRLRLARLVPRALLFGRRLGRGLRAHVGRVLGAWWGSGLGPVVSARARVAASSGGVRATGWEFGWVGLSAPSRATSVIQPCCSPARPGKETAARSAPSLVTRVSSTCAQIMVFLGTTTYASVSTWWCEDERRGAEPRARVRAQGLGQRQGFSFAGPSARIPDHVACGCAATCTHAPAPRARARGRGLRQGPRPFLAAFSCGTAAAPARARPHRAARPAACAGRSLVVPAAPRAHRPRRVPGHGEGEGEG